MNTQTQRSNYARLESDLVARMDSLFRRFPVLYGFSVQDRSNVTRERVVQGLRDDLYLADVVAQWPLSGEQAETLVEEISLALFELVEERPEASALLRGRTFARVLH